MAALLATLNPSNPSNYERALQVARVPEHIKGFGHVKARYLAAARQKWASL
ncbi:DUF6537 domain-containing protein [Limnohabitans sp.]|uniref:DUF6537 domain-containing protein n=1 Tax=Limnohabitans sp. TaxID=1907725 RepID=UPI00386211DA